MTSPPPIKRNLQIVRQQPLPGINPNPKYRLLIEQSGYGNSIRGAIKRGDESVYGWTAHGLPPDLARFMASHYYYDSTQRYFEMFNHATGGAYPIVFRDANGSETVLAYKGDHPCVAGITFDIRGNEVHISRSSADGVPLPDNAIVHGEMLLDIAAGVVVPVTNRGAWQSWEAVFEALDGANDDFDDDEWESEEWDDEEDGEPADINPELRFLRHTVIAPLELFNSSVIRLLPEVINDPGLHCHFKFNGISAEEYPVNAQTYLLDIPHGLAGTTTSLEPVGQYENGIFLFFQLRFPAVQPV